MRGARPELAFQRDRHVAFAVDAGEDDDAGAHQATPPKAFDDHVRQQLAAISSAWAGAAASVSAMSSTITLPARTSPTLAKPRPCRRLADRLALRVQPPRPSA